MSSRREIFANHRIYHVYNKTIDRKILFNQLPLSQLFTNLLWYYRHQSPKLRYSHFQKLEESTRNELLSEIRDHTQFRIEILAYVLMPNHFHLLLKQNKTSGIVCFMSDLINSFTRAFNSYSKRLGPLFLPRFKAKMMVTEEQLKHTSRYIHLNPYSSRLLEKQSDLANYQFSSLKEYLTGPNLCLTQEILSLFQGKAENYYQFMLNNAEHQKTLDYLKHLSKW